MCSPCNAFLGQQGTAQDEGLSKPWMLKLCPSSGEVEALIVIDSLKELVAEGLYAGILGQVQQVKAGVCDWQVMLSSTGRLDHQLQALHPQNGYAVTSREKYCIQRMHVVLL